MVRSFHRLDVSMDKGMKVSNSSVCIYVYVCVGTRVSVSLGMSTHSSTLAWKIPWTEEPGRLRFMGSQRVGQN